MSSFLKTCFFVGLLLGFWLEARAQPGPIKNLRYQDDFSHLKSDTVQKKGLDRLKFIPLSTNKKRHLSLGGEIREWYELRKNVNFGDLPPGVEPDNNGALLQRIMVHSDLHLGERLRLFTQLNSTFQIGSPNEPIPEITEDGLGLHQAFSELNLSPNSAKKSFLLRLGRQELNFGNELIISSREGPNNRLAFDAAGLILNSSKRKVHLFAATPVIINTEVFDNDHIDEIVWGAYANLNQEKQHKFDVYYFGFQSGRRAFNFQPGSQTRHTVGSRFFKHKGAFYYESEAMFQWGKFENLNINAYHFRGEARYHFTGKLKPMLGVGGSYISGDRSENDNQLNTYDPLYPKPTFGLGAPLGPANISSIRPIFGITPNFKLFFNGSIYFLARQSIADGSYTPGMVQVRSADGEQKGIGRQYALDIFWLPSPHWTLLSFMSWIPPGAYVKETGAGEDIYFFSLAAAYKF